MGQLEDRIKRLEESLILAPSIQEYLEAENRERARALQKVATLLVPYGFDGGYLFPEETLRMLSTDTQDQQEKDREIIDAWNKTHDRDRAAEVEGAKEKLLAILEARSTAL